MTKISFKGWLAGEIRILAPGEELRPASLARAAEANPRLTEYAVLYLLETGREAPAGSILSSDRSKLAYSYMQGGSFSDEESVPQRYRKTLASWRARRDRSALTAESKASRLAANVRLKERTGSRVAQMSRDLGINKGNLNAYFKYEDPSKLSLETATRVFRYLENREEELSNAARHAAD